LGLVVPLQRLGHKLAVLVDAGHLQHRHRRQLRGIAQLAGAALEQALVGHVLEHALERQLLRRRADAEGACQIALVHPPGRLRT
jgi:predicted kinase